MRPSLVLRLVVVCFLGLLWALVPSAALAHGVLVSSTPSDGDSLEVLPDVAVLTFSDEQVLAQVIVTGPQGEAVALAEPTIEGAVVSQALEGGGAGQYTLAYRSTAQDGHVLSGQIGFAVGEVARDASTDSKDEGAGADESGGPGGAADSEAAPVAGASSYDVPARDVVVPIVLLLAAGGLWVGAQRTARPSQEPMMTLHTATPTRREDDAG